MSQQQSKLFTDIKVAMKQNNIPLKKPITDNTGKPVLSTATKPRAAAMIKNVESSIKGSASGESVLNRLNIYQTASKNRNGKDVINKTMLTFRTLSKNSKSPWQIPARDGIKVLDQVYQWLQSNYERILSESLKNMQINLE